MPSKRLFLGNLSFNITARQLEQHIFGLNLGATEVIAIIDPGSGQCRGFGFAEFPSEALAIAALAFLSSVANAESYLEGRPIRADFAVERNRGKPHRQSEHKNQSPPHPSNSHKPQKHRQRENAQPYADVWSKDDRQRRRR